MRLVPEPAGVLGQIVPQVRAAPTRAARVARRCARVSRRACKRAALPPTHAHVHAFAKGSPPSAPDRRHRIRMPTFKIQTPQLRQTFERFDAPSPAAAADARMAHFKAALWPRLQEACARGGVLLFVPQYFDFVRIR